MITLHYLFFCHDSMLCLSDYLSIILITEHVVSYFNVIHSGRGDNQIHQCMSVNQFKKHSLAVIFFVNNEGKALKWKMTASKQSKEKRQIISFPSLKSWFFPLWWTIFFVIQNIHKNHERVKCKVHLSCSRDACSPNLSFLFIGLAQLVRVLQCAPLSLLTMAGST